jgi:amino acid transporter
MSDHHAIRRDIGPFALMLIGLGSIIGSGWLFGAWRAAGLAGPDAIWAWVIGALIVSAVALTYAELGAMFPESGGMVRYSQYSHGSLVGFVGAWSNWIAVVSVIPIEAEASVQYMASWHWPWAQALFVHKPDGHGGELTPPGLGIAAGLVIVYFLFNFWSVKLFARSNTLITTFKLIVPAMTAIALIASGFHPGNFSIGVNGGPHVMDFATVLTAVATAGIVFSFNGFQSPVNMAGEARDPGRNLPLAIIGAIGLATIVYLLLQVAYLGAVPPAMLAHGWHGIDFRSPFAELAVIVNLQWLAMLLYADAFISPSGTGMTYTATTARMLYAMQKNGTMPAVFGRVHPRYGVPRAGMWFDLAVGFTFLFFFRGWGSLAAVISVATIISYMTGPVSAMSLRRTAPDVLRPLRLPAMGLVSCLGFVFATELMYWARWPLTGEVILLIVIALPIYFYYQAKAGWQGFGQQVAGAAWLIAYMPAVALLSFLGSTKFGGLGYLPYGWDLLVVAVVALGFYAWGVRCGWRTPDIDALHRVEDAQHDVPLEDP